ncbi:MAG: hypothetical protein AAFX93_10935 [Verrucomicrobiota bacterium]
MRRFRTSSLFCPITQTCANYRSANANTHSNATYPILALAAYHQDHSELPETLDALVPDYIPTVPLDPFDGEPMRYDRDKRIIYSVGEDFVDNGGSEFPSQFEASNNDSSLGNIAEEDRLEPTYHIRFGWTD